LTNPNNGTSATSTPEANMSLRDYSENGQAFMRKPTEARRTNSDSRRRRLRKKRDEWRTQVSWTSIATTIKMEP
jgi:hypothetical protein